MSASGPSDIWAVGQTGTSALVEHWDGTSWTFMPTPSGLQYPTLNSVAARAACGLWANPGGSRVWGMGVGSTNRP